MLQIELEKPGEGVCVVRLVGRLLMGPDGEQLEKLVADEIARGGRRLVFDLTNLKSLDSTGIGRCIACFQIVSQSGGRMVMAAAQPIVRQGFRITRLDTVIPFKETLEEALAA
jgi:anti-sigma B factor antagonist